MTEKTKQKKRILTFHARQRGGIVHDPQTFVAEISVVNSTFVAKMQPY